MDQGAKNTNTRNATETLGGKNTCEFIYTTHVSADRRKKKKNMKINQKFIRLCKTVGEKKKVGEKRMERKGVEIEVERIGK